MIDLGPHANFIIAAYGVTALALGALVVATFADDREQRRNLADLEHKGIRRRSAAKPAKPKVTSPKVTSKKVASKTAKKRTTKRKSSAPAKRKPARKRTRKTRS